MQELISKEAVLKLARQLETHLVWYTPTELEPKEFIKKIDSLPTTVHHEYKVGNLKLIEAEEAIKLLVEYSDKLPQWLLEKMSNLPIQVTPSNSMKKLIPLAQVEQLIDEMMNQRENALHSIWNDKYLQDSRTRINWEKITLERLKSKLSSLPTEESGWIAVKDGLPEILEAVIICSWGSEILIAHYAGMNKNDNLPDFFDINMTLYYTTHWMPLPKPPLQ